MLQAIILFIVFFVIVFVVGVVIFGGFNFCWDNSKTFKTIAFLFFVYCFVNAAHKVWTGKPLFFW